VRRPIPPVSTDWPLFATGPRDSIFALGVICVKFVELESIFQFLFETILGFDPDRDVGKTIFAKLGTRPALQLSQDYLPKMERSDEVKALVSHFLKAMEICAENRNVLMHSHLAWKFGTETVLFKKSRSGNDLYLSIPLAQLRQVADEMDVYCIYGERLGNAINNTMRPVPVFPVTAMPWPKKPDLPAALKYGSVPDFVDEPYD
jgi:hypothetical protein